MRLSLPAQWTAACLSDDLPPGVVTPGVCNGSDVVVWRSASGKVSAWSDRCQHRGMRLSHGFVRGETLSCIYHGWVYGTGGVCKSIPAHPNLAPPEAIRAQTFSCVESNGIVWMAEAGADGAPPEVGELTPVRSLVIVGSAKLLQQALPAGFKLFQDAYLGGQVALAGREIAVALVLQSLGESRMKVHTLAGPLDDSSTRVAISRWLENLRRNVEDGVTP